MSAQSNGWHLRSPALYMDEDWDGPKISLNGPELMHYRQQEIELEAMSRWLHARQFRVTCYWWKPNRTSSFRIR